MILLIGGIGSGKHAYAESLGYGPDDFTDGVERSSAVLVDAQELVREPSCDVEPLARRIADEYAVVLFTDVGSGIVPLSPDERAWRDRAGALSRALADRATSVVRLVCGIPSLLKGSLPYTSGPVRVVIMRHGTTVANERREYAGTIDVKLTEAGEQQAREAGVCSHVSDVYVTPLQRSRRTAEICFPQACQHVVDGLREMNFGDFEGRSARDMEDDAAYRAWVDGYCEDRCPGGESRAELSERVAAAMRDTARDAIARGDEWAIVVAHGGTIMATMDAFADAQRGYFDWHVGNCQGYSAEARFVDGQLQFTNWEQFNDLGFLVKACASDASADGAALRYPPHRFFQNRACKYFPCHTGVEEDEFNCLFCYCPLYALGPDCGGDFTYTKSGRKNCISCSIPHRGDSGCDLVSSHYELLAELASDKNRN